MSMMSGLFGSVCNCDITIDPGDPGRKTAPTTRERSGPRGLIYTTGEDIFGTAMVSVKPGKQLEHQGIRVELIGQVESLTDKSGSYDFFSIAKDMEPPGSLFESKQYKWKFNSVDFSNETYAGLKVRLRFFVRLSVQRNYSANVTKDTDIVVQSKAEPPDLNNELKMEVGLTDCLHIEFEYDRSKFHMKDVIVGKVYFVLVRIKIKHMELNIVRREITSPGGTSSSEAETLTKFEIMDGAPVRDQCIPVRLYMNGLDLTPTYRNVQNKFSVKYFLNLVLVDNEDRRYFKQQEIFIWRKKIG